MEKIYCIKYLLQKYEVNNNNNVNLLVLITNIYNDRQQKKLMKALSEIETSTSNDPSPRSPAGIKSPKATGGTPVSQNVSNQKRSAYVLLHFFLI